MIPASQEEWKEPDWQKREEERESSQNKQIRIQSCTYLLKTEQIQQHCAWFGCIFGVSLKPRCLDDKKKKQLKGILNYYVITQSNMLKIEIIKYY